MITPIAIDGREIGPEFPPYIIAELSGNHNGDINRAIELINIASEAGADAVKLQTYTADTITIDHDGPDFVIKDGLWKGKKLYELYDESHTPWDWHDRLFKCARKLGITIFSSPFDYTAVDLLYSLNAPAYKIASFENIDTPLIKRVAEKDKPVIISTGMASQEEISEAVETVQNVSSAGLVLLHCVSGYPTPPSEANLATISDMATNYNVPVGLSDHTLGIAVPVAAVALGACLIEKHITLSRHEGGPDSAFSLEPKELLELVEQCRNVYSAIGKVDYSIKNSESSMKKIRRSLFATKNIKKNEILSHQNIRSIRPGTGLAPKHLPRVLEKKAAMDIPFGTPLEFKHLKETK